MVEGGAQEVPEETILEVIMAAHEEIKNRSFQEDMKAKVGKENAYLKAKTYLLKLRMQFVPMVMINLMQQFVVQINNNVMRKKAKYVPMY